MPLRRRGEEEAAALVICEQVHREQREAARLFKPAQLAGGDMKLVEAVRNVRVVVEVPGAGGTAVAVAPTQTARLSKAARAGSRRVRVPVDPVGTIQATSRLGERGERKAVPRGDRLVVQPGLRSDVPGIEQAFAQLRVELATDDRAAVLERLQELRRGRPLRRPRVRQSLDAVGVSVLRGGERSLDQEQVAEHVLERLLGDLAIALLPVTSQPWRYAGASSALS